MPRFAGPSVRRITRGALRAWRRRVHFRDANRRASDDAGSAVGQNAREWDRARPAADVPVIAGDHRQPPDAGDGRSFAICNSRVRDFARRLVRLVAKQQTAALAATLVDYLVMAACASGAGMSAAAATACGALVGMFVGFTLGRRWVFEAVEASAMTQAWRYFAVSLVSLVANAAGEAALVGAGLHYLAARPVISTAVGLGWNLPMQQLFVFRRDRRA